MGKLLSNKIISLVVMSLGLIFALSQVEWKTLERKNTRDQAVSDISRQYASEQQWVGPLVYIKCSEWRIKQETVKENGKDVVRKTKFEHDCSQTLRPKSLVMQGNLAVNERYRGIYKARVYLGSLQLQARLPAWQPKPGQTVTAALAFAVSDARGLKRIELTAASGQKLTMHPGTIGNIGSNGFYADVPLEFLQKEQNVSADVELAGSGGLNLLPVAESNDISLNSAWPHPSFVGMFLPETRQIKATGFTAHWRINDFATGGDKVLNGLKNESESGHAAAAFGVSLIDPIDTYSQTDRAIRYGFLFVLLTIGGCFIFESITRRSLHPMQYLLTGFAVVIFFLLLLAVSEHLVFAQAYIIAAAACVALIGVYGRSLTGSWGGAALLGGGYGGLYFGLYWMLASEDYALLMGAWLIFSLLALTMYLTRKLDWSSAAAVSKNAQQSAMIE